MRPLEQVLMPTASDLAWLSKADIAGPPFHSLPLQFIVDEIVKGKTQLHRFVPGPGVMLTEVVTSVNGMKRLNLLRAGGHGVGWTFRQLAEQLQHIAREAGCAEVMTMVYSRRLAEAMRRVGAKAEAISMVLEV